MTETWINDRLYDILGLTDRSISRCFLALAEKSSSTDDLQRRIQESDTINVSDVVKSFADELYRKFPRTSPEFESRSGSDRAQEAALKVAEWYQSFQLRSIISDSDEAKRSKIDKSRRPDSTATNVSGYVESGKQRHLRERRKENSSSSSSDGDTLNQSSRPLKAKKQVLVKSEVVSDHSGESDLIVIEEEHLSDLRARDELADRINMREKEKTRSIVEKLENKAYEPAAKRLRLQTEDHKKVVPQHRWQSRKEYLKIRADDKLLELESNLLDEKQLFSEVKLSRREQADFEYNSKILECAKEYKRASNLEKVKRYHMPEEVHTIPNDYVEVDAKRGPESEQRNWEDEKLMQAVLHFGAKDAKSKQKEYQYVLEESIDFMRAALPLAGENEEMQEEISEAIKRKLNIEETRKALPIYKFRARILQAVRDHQVLIIVGETGSGKTTQIPQYLYEAGYCKDGMKLGCTQPRRVAAMSVAARVSEEMGFKLGAQVGYAIRFEDYTSERTVLKYMTDGMLLREFLTEPDLKSYSVVIIDEAHERTLHTDVLFGLVKDISRFRPELKLLISSATIDAKKFSTFFDDAPIIRIPGRRFPVDIFYTKAPEADYIAACVVTILQIHLTQPLLGDILVFLTGQEEIDYVQEILQERRRQIGTQMKELIVVPIYANLPSDLQANIFEPTPKGARKVILATNIAETSLTIDGIVYVIDPGFVKQTIYNARNGTESLIVVPISKASADQRAGRAGRVGPGKCYRLYTAWAFKHELEDQPIPEIQRVKLGNVVLMLKSLGINDLIHFDFLDPPPRETLALALEQLYALSAVDHRGELTKLGRRMAEFPLDPMLSKMLIASEKYKCSEEILTISAMLSVNNSIFYRPKDKIVDADMARKSFFHTDGDHMTLLNIYNQWKETDYSKQWCYGNFIQHRSMKRARNVRDQLKGLMERVEVQLTSNIQDTVAIRKAITAGFFYHTACLSKDGQYKTAKHQQTVMIHPNSCLFQDTPRWLIYYELAFTTKTYMRVITEIENRWLLEVAPHYYKQKQLMDDSAKKMPQQKGKTREELTRRYTAEAM